jgi:hypothetical protein
MSDNPESFQNPLLIVLVQDLGGARLMKVDYFTQAKITSLWKMIVTLTRNAS